MSARFDRHRAGPRRAVRYTYLIDAWPEGKGLDDLDAFEQAPDSAVIAALTREVDALLQHIDEAHASEDRAHDELDVLRAAVRAVIESAEPEAVSSLKERGGCDG